MPAGLDEHRLEGVHGDAIVCPMPRWVYIVVAPPVSVLTPVYADRIPAGRRNRCDYSKGHICTLRFLSTRNSLAGHVCAVSNCATRVLVSASREQSAVISVQGPTLTIRYRLHHTLPGGSHGHERRDIVPRPEQDCGKPILPHDHHAVVTQLAGAHAKHSRLRQQLQCLCIHRERP